MDRDSEPARFGDVAASENAIVAGRDAYVIQVPAVAHRVLLLEWAPAQLKRYLQELIDKEPETYQLVEDAVGDPPDPDRLVSAIAAPSPRERAAGPSFWKCLALVAQARGEWKSAAAAWTASASREQQTAPKADALARASVAADIAGDTADAAELRLRAEATDPECARLRVLAVDHKSPPREQLDALERIETKEKDLLQLVAAKEMLALLRLGELDEAEGCLHRLGGEEAGSQPRMLKINLEVQRGRIASLAKEPLDAAALEQARSDAYDLRSELHEQKRWSESASLLMLAVDTAVVLRDYERAAHEVRSAREEEIAGEYERLMIAQVAQRAAAWDYVLGLVEGAETSEARLISATALLEVGSPDQRHEAESILDSFMQCDDKHDAVTAAHVLLSSRLRGPRHRPNEAAIACLRRHGQDEMAAFFEAVDAARGGEDYVAVLEPFAKTTWGAASRLEVALLGRDRAGLRDAADGALAAGPSQATRLMAGEAFLEVEDFGRALEVLMVPARDRSAPRRVRADAYAHVVPMLGHRLNDWRQAKKLHLEWTQTTPDDDRMKALAPTIASRIS